MKNSHLLEFRYLKLSSEVLLFKEELDPNLSLSGISDRTGDAFRRIVSSINCFA